MRTRKRPSHRIATLAVLAVGGALGITAVVTTPGLAQSASHKQADTATPIKHLIVVFQENVSFDHYFGTYPHATNTDGQTWFPAAGTPTVNGLTPALLAHNPNSANPQRLGPAQALTCDQDHDYTPEQKAMDHGLMDKFVQNTETSSCSAPDYGAPGLVMDYYDGNTVTALWNYAQRFAMSDNSFDTEFGPSTPGALNLVSGQTHGATPADDPDSTVNGSVIGDPDPAYDDCSGSDTVTVSGPNVGDLLNQNGVTWGWFQGGFRPTAAATSTTKAVCGSTHNNIGGVSEKDYSPHHNPFEYYASTSNPHHVPPASVSEIGHNGQANHEYDLSDFYDALHYDQLPAVSFVKAARYQDGHPANSDPLDEQNFLVTLSNAVQNSKDWKNTAIVIAYDDSDGWYDHVMPPILNPSHDTVNDALSAPGHCGNGTPMQGYQDRCGYGPRLPLLVLSPYAKRNFVDSSLTDQTSILRFVEDNWMGGSRIGNGSYDGLAGSLANMFDFDHPDKKAYYLDPTTGQPVH
jgi:phospholipase C